jgi:glycosyltransferase involved in cell wall biosynthesis
MRILYLQPCASFGGAERQCATMIPRLGELGFDVLPLVGPNGLIARWLDEQGVTGTLLTLDFPGAWPPARGVARLRLPARYARCRRRIAERVDDIVRSAAIDLVFAAMPFSWAAATAVCRRAGVPIVWRAGGTVIRPLESAALAAWSRVSPPDLLLCCSQAVHDVFAPLVAAPAAVVRNGVDLAMFAPDEARAPALRPRGAPLVVGFAARLAPPKRPQDFVAMAARVARTHPEATFLVAGEGSRRARYEEMARAAGLGDRLRFLGFVGDMASFYAACDIVTLPSQSEGCPNVVLEAMAMRRPIVAADTPATAEVLRHDRDGLLYPVGDVRAFTAAVERLADRPALRDHLAAAARARVVREFDARTRAVNLAAVLRAVVSRRRAEAGAAALVC